MKIEAFGLKVVNDDGTPFFEVPPIVYDNAGIDVVIGVQRALIEAIGKLYFLGIGKASLSGKISDEVMAVLKAPISIG